MNKLPYRSGDTQAVDALAKAQQQLGEKPCIAEILKVCAELKISIRGFDYLCDYYGNGKR